MRRTRITTLISAGVLMLAGCSKNEEKSESDTVVDEADTEESTTESGESTEESGFIPAGDMPAANTCDPWAQDCPEGEKCAAYNMGGDTWDANKCVPVMGDGVSGDPCTYDGAAAGTDDCAVGHMCYYTNAEGVGTCIPLCTGTPDEPMCPSEFNCSVSNDGSLLLCVYNCNPVLQDCEFEGTGCFWDGATFNCDPAGDIPEGEPCGYINDCLPGHICLDPAALPMCSGSGCCAAYCDIMEPTCAIEGTECVSFWDEGTAPPGLENIGICALPG